LFGLKGLTPPPNSYGSNPKSELGVWLIELSPGGKITIPAAEGGNEINRKAFFTEGKTLSISNQSIEGKKEITLFASQEVEFENTDPEEKAEILILQGRPLNEPVVQHGPFVMNSQEEISQAFADYRKTEFGGWPWDQEDKVFPREKGRFALLNGKESVPPTEG
jgi:redox-sensitive bicupin YhaK (pirin superfamily)